MKDIKLLISLLSSGRINTIESISFLVFVFDPNVHEIMERVGNRDA